MPRWQPGTRVHPHVLAIMRDTGEGDPFSAIRVKARTVLREYHQLFGGVPPFNIHALASMRGLRHVEETPRFSHDSEIAPEADGCVILRVNPDRPPTRQRFSIAHEVGHTLFPEYQLKLRSRKGHGHPAADPNDLLETLCDMAAAEFIFPEPWFPDRAHTLTLDAASLAALACEYEASRDATVRRFVEVRSEPLAAVFLSWKLKPTEERQLARDRNQQFMFDEDPVADAAARRKLRVDYAIINDAFANRFTTLIPRDKSIPSDGPIHDASITQTGTDGASYLDLGSLHGDFAIHTLPIYTAEDCLGPTGGCSVVAIIHPT